jgi:hypothetical protein
MQASDLPPKFQIPFGTNAVAGNIRSIPVAHQPATATDAPASLNDGFPPETFVNPAAGGIPPNGADFNGLFNLVTAWSRWQGAGGTVLYDADFASAVGGYPNRAVVASPVTARFWQSTVDGNMTDPESSAAANWIMLLPARPNTSNGVNGYRQHADGYIEQWGTVAIPSGSNTASFSFSWNINFVSIVHTVLGNADRAGNNAWAPVSAVFPGTNFNGTGCICDTGNANVKFNNGALLRWRAWGY